MTRPVFYRTALTRVSFAISGAGLTYAFSPWAPTAWRNTPSLHWLHRGLPWLLIAVMFAVYTLLLLTGDVIAAAAADGIGATLWAWELVALIVTTQVDHPQNPFLLVGAFLVMVFHLAAGRLAILQAFRHES